MRKNIDIDETTLTKLKVLSTFEGMTVKGLMEKAVSFFVEQKEWLSKLSDEEKENLGLLLLMQQADRTETVSEDEVMAELRRKRLK